MHLNLFLFNFKYFYAFLILILRNEMTRIYYQNKAFSIRNFLSLELKDADGFFQNVQQIINFWETGVLYFMLYTSGSTGKPKKITFTREQLIISAQRTIHYFELEKKDNLYCCLSPDHAAGLMMIIRALVLGGGLVLSLPSKNPLNSIENSVKIDFAAFVPYQFAAVINDSDSLNKLSRCKSVILGGGPLPASLKSKISGISFPVFNTYGMTETLTHIALMRMNGSEKDQYFKVMPGIGIHIDCNSCLKISPDIYPRKSIFTHDIVKLIDANTFEYIGRVDHVINSGGVKIHPEKITDPTGEIINHLLGETAFFYYGEEDEILGQRLVLYLEHAPVTPITGKILKETLIKKLSKYEVPKMIYYIPGFEYTSIGKIDHRKTVEKMKKNSR